MFDQFQYPPVSHFTKIMFATEPGAGQFQWAAGFVVNPKNQSCDLVVFRPDGAIDYRSDCWHADDPRCKSSPEMYRQFGRGVFRLAPDEQDNRRQNDEFFRLRRESREVAAKVERLIARQIELESEIAKLKDAPFETTKPISKGRKEAALAD